MLFLGTNLYDAMHNKRLLRIGRKKKVSIKGLPGVNVSSANTLKGHQCVSDETAYLGLVSPQFAPLNT